ncbi:MAG: glycosyltransferase family 2 protein [Weeksellaceae bacterium]
MKNKLTLTIGIPAHNEEQNIKQLLLTILKQKQTNFDLKKIYVVCDGCTDNTAAIVESFIKKHKTKNIVLLNDGKRTGKATRLNMITKLATTDTLITIDADVVFENKNDIDLMAQRMLENEELLLVGPRYVPLKANTLMGKFAVYSYLFFEEAILKLHNGHNIYALMGCCSMIRKQLYKSFKYPKSVISDQNYLYLTAQKLQANSFDLVKEAHVVFRTVTTFNDWLVLSVRSVRGDKASVEEHFGKETLMREYTMPRKYLLMALLHWMFKQPFYTAGAVLMNIVIRIYPYQHHEVMQGIWESTASSKAAIIL